MNSKHGDHEKSPDPYLLGRLMGSSYANYPSAFTIASRGASNPLSSQQLLMSQTKANRGFNMKSSDEPIYVDYSYQYLRVHLKHRPVVIYYHENFQSSGVAARMGEDMNLPWSLVT